MDMDNSVVIAGRRGLKGNGKKYNKTFKKIKKFLGTTRVATF